jgi:hypothetical protein
MTFNLSCNFWFLQVAEQQGKYLAKCLNATASAGPGCPDESPPFQYRSMGSMASVGGRSAILELGDARSPTFSWGGFSSWVAWRSAYLTRLGTIKNRLYVATNWTLTLLFGRCVTLESIYSMLLYALRAEVNSGAVWRRVHLGINCISPCTSLIQAVVAERSRDGKKCCMCLNWNTPEDNTLFG